MLPSVLSSLLLVPLVSWALAEQAPLFEAGTSATQKFGADKAIAHRNGPHIFNAIHSSMRQWGSSLKHNGMSFFPATIPANTHLYHGTDQKEPVTGMEWLAFEIEHAEIFARGFRSRPPGKGRPHPGEPGREPPKEDTLPTLLRPYSDFPSQGYLHIYRTKRDLSRLIYIDGMSAGKTGMGTLDTTDYVLRGVKNPTEQPWLDHIRAEELCALGADWGLEGFIRMEAGFELILCNFTDGVVLESVRQRPEWSKPEGRMDVKQYEYMRAVSLRYHGITAGRVILDYSSMISAYFYPLNLTNPNAARSNLPRLDFSQQGEIQRMREDLRGVLQGDKGQTHHQIEWQGVVDMIVSRYSDRLKFIVMEATTADEILSELHNLLSIYINYEEVDTTIARNVCSTHYLQYIEPKTPQDHLIYEGVMGVTQEVCNTLFRARDCLLSSGNRNISGEKYAKQWVSELISFLDWSTWLECGKCGYDEVCLVALWPWGAPEDHDHPSCIKHNDTAGHFGYWDMKPRGPDHLYNSIES